MSKNSTFACFSSKKSVISEGAGSREKPPALEHQTTDLMKMNGLKTI